NTAIYVGSLDTKGTKRILTEQSNATYAPPGYLLFARDGTLMAQRFDVTKLELTGDVFPVAARIDQGTPNAFGFFSVSADGSVIAYCEGNRASRRLAWFDRDGSNLGFRGAEQEGYSPRLSPDGRLLAVVADDPASGNRDV